MRGTPGHERQHSYYVPSFPTWLLSRFMENVRAHSDRKSQALVLVVSEVPCPGLLAKPGPSLSESQTQVTTLPSAYGLTATSCSLASLCSPDDFVYFDEYSLIT